MSIKGQLHVGQTGLFKEKYLIRKSQAVAQKMWNNFETFWTREFTNYELVNRLSAKEAEFGANAATHVSQSTMSELEDAMDNLVYAATTRNSVLEPLTETNKKLTEQLKYAHSLIKKLQDENATLLRIIETS
eukprot:9223593-Ditylum_brightwellii.AAC.1